MLFGAASRVCSKISIIKIRRLQLIVFPSNTTHVIKSIAPVQVCNMPNFKARKQNHTKAKTITTIGYRLLPFQNASSDSNFDYSGKRDSHCNYCVMEEQRVALWEMGLGLREYTAFTVIQSGSGLVRDASREIIGGMPGEALSLFKVN